MTDTVLEELITEFMSQPLHVLNAYLDLTQYSRVERIREHWRELQVSAARKWNEEGRPTG